MEQIKDKTYILPLEFDNQIKNLYFCGASSDNAKEAFKNAYRGINSIGDSSKDFGEFIEKVIRHFADFGFDRIKK